MELYKRSIGQMYDERALALEISGGVVGYDTEDLYSQASASLPEFSVDWSIEEAHVSQLIAEELLFDLEREHPKDTVYVANALASRLDQLKAEGHPVDAIMYVEADELAEKLVEANPEKDAGELIAVVEALVQVARVEYLTRDQPIAA
jgi:hypothetical protein